METAIQRLHVAPALPLADGAKTAEGKDYTVVATTRPETVLGDTGVAVNPEDPRYKDLIGKEIILPLVGRRIRIVGDEHADMEKGTGCVKITRRTISTTTKSANATACR